MGSRDFEFSRHTQERALERQGHKCGSCGTHISAIGEAGRATHAYGESAQAHHIQHHKHGGDDSLANCIVLCWSCHYSAHEGGNYRHGRVDGTPSDYPYYHG